jgi:hypothetical protein
MKSKPPSNLNPVKEGGERRWKFGCWVGEGWRGQGGFGGRDLHRERKGEGGGGVDWHRERNERFIL